MQSPSLSKIALRTRSQPRLRSRPARATVERPLLRPAYLPSARCAEATSDAGDDVAAVSCVVCPMVVMRTAWKRALSARLLSADARPKWSPRERRPPLDPRLTGTFPTGATAVTIVRRTDWQGAAGWRDRCISAYLVRSRYSTTPG